MEKLTSNEIKIGILSDIRRRIVKQFSDNTKICTITIGDDLREILFTEKVQENETVGSDILYPTFEYPILEHGPIFTRTMGVTKKEDLGPLLEYYGLYEFSSQDLLEFFDETLLNEKWLNDCGQLFGFNEKKFGPVSIRYSYQCMRKVFPEALETMICKIKEKDLNLSLSKKEQKQYRLR